MVIGDLVVLHAREVPRVRVDLDVWPGGDGGKVVVLAPDATDGERAFLGFRVVTEKTEVEALGIDRNCTERSEVQ